MRKSLFRSTATLCFAFIIIVIGKYVIIAQSPVIGEWKADTRSEKAEKADRIHLSFTRETQWGKNQNGQSYSYDELRGLTRQQAEAGGAVRFSLVREAGTVECEGFFTNGKGSGTFTFTPDRSFVDAMRSRGFDFEKSDGKGKHDDIGSRLFTAAMVNVTTALADDLRAANFADLDVGDLFKAAIFKVDSKFIAEMKASGFPNLSMGDLVKARIFKIDADYVRQVHEMGFSDKGFEQLVKFRIFKVTPEFLSELKSAGLKELDAEDIVKCRIFNIDAEFIRKAKAEDPNVTIEELVRTKIGVRRAKAVI
jgi:hypothetical protein